MTLKSKYSLRMWLLSGGIAFLLSQIPLYYLYHDKFSLIDSSYVSLDLDLAGETIEAMCYLIIPWLFILNFAKRLYDPVWSTRQLRWVLLLIAEFLTMFFLLDGVSIFNTHLLLSTGIMLSIFAISTAASIFISDVGALKDDLFRQVKELE